MGFLEFIGAAVLLLLCLLAILYVGGVIEFGVEEVGGNDRPHR